jgi:hypothetical protein
MLFLPGTETQFKFPARITVTIPNRNYGLTKTYLNKLNIKTTLTVKVIVARSV